MVGIRTVAPLEPHVIRPRVPRGRRRTSTVPGGVLVLTLSAALLAGCSTARPAPGPTTAADGLRHTAVQVTLGGCGTGWTHPHAGTQVFDVRNDSDRPTEVHIVAPATGLVYGEVEGLAPGTSRPLQVTLGGGRYAFLCLPDDAAAIRGPTVAVAGHATAGPAARAVTEQDLIPPTLAYQKWIGGRMKELAARVGTLRDDIDRGDLAAARTDWLTAHLVYERMGAAYDTFGDADGAINGTTAGLPGGSHDPDFTGFHRIEYGLWHGQDAARLKPFAARLVDDVATLRVRLAAGQDGSADDGSARARDPGEHRAVRADRPHRLRQRQQPGHRPRQPRRHRRGPRPDPPAARRPGRPAPAARPVARPGCATPSTTATGTAGGPRWDNCPAPGASS